MKWPRPSSSWKEVAKRLVTTGGSGTDPLGYSSPAFAWERAVKGEKLSRDKGLPQVLACSLSCGRLAMVFFAQAVILGYKLGIVQRRFGRKM